MLVGETWGEGEVRFDDRTTAPISMPSTPISMALLQFYTFQKKPTSVSFAVKSVVVPDIPLPYWTDFFGNKHYADDMVLTVYAKLTIEVNGVMRYQSPDAGGVYWAGNKFNPLFDIRGGFLGLDWMKRYEPGEQAVPVSVDNWRVDPYLSDTSDTKVVIRCTQEWKLYGAWVEYLQGAYTPIIDLGKPKQGNAPLIGSGDWIELGKEVWGALINPEQLTIIFPKKPDLPPKGFRLGATPLTVTMGKTGYAAERSFQVGVQTYGDYSGTIQLSSVLPTGFNSQIKPTSISASPSTTLYGAEMILTVNPTTVDGAYTAKIVGSDGTQSSEVTITILLSKNETKPDERRGRIATTISLSLSESNVRPKAKIVAEGKLTDALLNVLPDKEIWFASSFGWTGKVKTDYNGRFTAEFEAPETIGLHRVSAEFKGEGTFAGEKKEVAFEVSEKKGDGLQDLWDRLVAWLLGIVKANPWIMLVLIIFGILIVLIIILLIVKALRWAAASPSKEKK